MVWCMQNAKVQPVNLCKWHINFAKETFFSTLFPCRTLEKMIQCQGIKAAKKKETTTKKRKVNKGNTTKNNRLNCKSI